ncbi:MAG: DUF58 domain-containing protein [Pseudobdellovibrio sp.]
MKNFFKKIQLRFKPRANNTKPYIIPTSLGLSYGFLILLIIIISLNNKNNLIFLFAFFLFSVGITTTLLTNKNLEKLQLLIEKNQYFFQNEKHSIYFKIQNTGKQNIFEIVVKWSSRKLNLPSSIFSILKLSPQQSTLVVLEYEFPKYGLQHIPEITIESVFPFNFLKVWKYRNFTDEKIWVFPERQNYLTHQMFESQKLNLNKDDTVSNQTKTLDDKDFSYLDKSPDQIITRDINWKSYAKTDTLYINKYDSRTNSQKAVNLDWDQTEILIDFQKRKSQMSFWIYEIYKNKIKLEILFPQNIISINSGSKSDFIQAMIYLTQLQESEPTKRADSTDPQKKLFLQSWIKS